MGSTHVVEQLSFSLFLSILTFDFDSILGSFLTFWGPNGCYLGWGRVQTLFWGLLVEQPYFSMLPYILTFDFELILGSFLTFWGPKDPNPEVRVIIFFGKFCHLFVTACQKRRAST